MRISQASTGNKLKDKTFGEVKEGETIYWALYDTKDIENAIYIVKTIKGGNKSVTNAWTDLNPKKQETINCDLLLKLYNKNMNDTYYRSVPSNATYCADNYSVYATSQELLIQVLKQYNIASPLI